MQQLDAIEQKILETIDLHREEILEFARDIYHHAELGYKEFRTAGRFRDILKQLGLDVKDRLAVTGVKGYLNPQKAENVSLALIGELDALRIPTHKYANPETQGAHCCGHHAQLAGVIGAAIALSDPAVREALDGQVVFFAVPAEEYGEIEFKNQLMDEGKIRYGGGKCELIRIGAFDDVDLSIAHHTGQSDVFIGNGSNNGFVSKVIHYEGKAAHAASRPHNGINALNAASIGLTALAYHRETFRDKDSVRIHPIVTQGGDLVNVVPDAAVVETLVRAGNAEAIADADKKTDRAFKAGAMALGAKVTISTRPGYLPTIPHEANPSLVQAAKKALDFSGMEASVTLADPTQHSGGSTDLGDLHHIQPVLAFGTGGMKAEIHSSEFDIVDEEKAYILTAKIFALGAYDLLREGAAKAKEIIESYQPVLTKEQYVEYMETMFRDETVDYANDTV